MLLTQESFISQIKECNLNDAVNRMNDRHVVHNLAPVADKPKKRLSKRERRQERIYQAGLKKKAARMPVFSAAEQAIWEPSASELKYRRLFQKAKQHFNNGGPPVTLADSVDDPAKKEILERSERLTEFYNVNGYAPGSMADPNTVANEAGAVTSSDVAAGGETMSGPTSAADSVAVASDLKSKVLKAIGRHGDKERVRTVKAYRRHQAACRAQAAQAFEAAVAIVRANTRSRLDRDGKAPVDIRAEAECLFLGVESRAVGNARRLLESHTGRVYDIHAGLLYRAALDTFIQATSGVHSNPDAPVAGMDDAAEALSKSFSASFYAMIIKSGCKNVIVCSGTGSDGATIPLKAARLLSGYRCLLPAD